MLASPRGGRIITSEVLTPRSPRSRSTNAPSMSASPCTSSPKSRKNALAAARSSTITPIWSIRLILISPASYSDPAAGSTLRRVVTQQHDIQSHRPRLDQLELLHGHGEAVGSPPGGDALGGDPEPPDLFGVALTVRSRVIRRSGFAGLFKGLLLMTGPAYIGVFPEWGKEVGESGACLLT